MARAPAIPTVLTLGGIGKSGVRIPFGKHRHGSQNENPAGGDSLLILMFIRHTGWQQGRGSAWP